MESETPFPVFISNIMARRKATENDVVETDSVLNSIAENINTLDNSLDASECKKLKNTEIPGNVMGLLKTFNKHPELLITKNGGVFTSDTKLPAHTGAILYKNPFYKS